MKTYALPVVAVEIATVVAAFREGMRIRLNVVTVGLACLLLIAWVTAFVAPIPAPAVLRTSLWTLHALFGFSAARLFRADDLTDGLLAGFIAFGALLAVFVVTAPREFDWIYEMPGLGNVRRFGFYAAAIVGLCLGRLSSGRWSTAVVSSLAFGLAFWSGSRGAVMAAVVGLGLSLVLFPMLRKTRVWGVFVTTAVLGMAAAAMIGSPEKLQGPARMTDGGDNGRIEVWRAAIDLIGANPWFGYGEGQMRALAELPYVMHPHNVVLQVLLAWGVIGFALVVAVALWAARRMIRQVDEQSLPSCCAAIILAAYSMTDGTLYNVHPVAIFAACVGVAARSRQARLCQEETSEFRPVGQSSDLI